MKPHCKLLIDFIHTETVQRKQRVDNGNNAAENETNSTVQRIQSPDKENNRKFKYSANVMLQCMSKSLCSNKLEAIIL
jgi:hypothetical protein